MQDFRRSLDVSKLNGTRRAIARWKAHEDRPTNFFTKPRSGVLLKWRRKDRMNVVLPLGRLAYSPGTQDKPLQLTAALGRPILFWLLDSLQLDRENDVVWIVVSAKDESTYQIFNTLSAEYRDLKTSWRLRLIPLYFKTRGVVETLQVALQYMTDTDKEKRTLCINGDMIFNATISDVSRSLPPSSLACFVTPAKQFTAQCEHTLDHGYNWCHCDVGNPTSTHETGTHFVCEMKRVTFAHASDNVMVGAYAFGSAQLLSSLVTRTLQTSIDLGFPDLVEVSMDIALSDCVAILIPSHRFTPLKCVHHVRNFIDNKARLLKSRPMDAGKSTRYVFQMYGGLLSDNDTPRKHVVDAVRQLKELGHHIIVSSSRGRSAGAVQTLMKQLEEFAILYDEIELHDDEKDYTVMVGSYVCDARSDLHTALGLPGEVQLLDAVQPRHFNQVTFHNNTVTKRSDAETLSGEAFYYENIPEHLKKLFPTLLSKHVADDGTMSITISKVEGVTFSQCLVNRCISEIQVNCLLRSIMLLHGSHNATCPAIRHAADVYENYASKVERRFEQNYKLYERICMSQGKTDAMVLITPIVSALKEYRDHNRADVREFIHGDPVFSNCMRSISGETVLLDMNGKLGNTLTTSGDCAYDLAKILQSLYGYDYILLDVPIEHEDSVILQRLRKFLREHVTTHYQNISWHDILLITASLFVSLIPLHKDFSHQVKFWHMGISVYECWKTESGNNRTHPSDES